MLQTVAALAVMTTLPPLSIALCYVSTKGITTAILCARLSENASRAMVDVWNHSVPTTQTVGTLACFWTLATLLYWLPGPIKSGPLSPTGHEPCYTDNGTAHAILFSILFVMGSVDGFYAMSVLFDHLQSLVVVLNVLGIALSVGLYLKGRRAPSTRDATLSEHGALYDFCVGIELYPRIGGIDVKKLVVCRVSNTFWMLFGLSCVDASNQVHSSTDWGLVCSATLTFLHVFKFFVRESEYMRSFGIIEEHAGFTKIWGSLVLVPAVYTNHLHYTVRHPSELSFGTAASLGAVGIVCILLNYWADRQRQVFRETEGRSMLWWPTPPKAMRVDYETEDDRGRASHEALLLVNGFWGVVRHPQYVFELGVALTCGLLGNPVRNGMQPLLYFVCLTCLLAHRAQRDATRCRRKYGAGYKAYMANVPHMIVPGVY